MELKYVTYEKRDSVALVTLNRPEKLNALNRELLQDLLRALELAERDPSVRVVVITGSGRAFCAGADVAEFAKSAHEVKNFIELGRRVLEYVESMSKPVIAAVNGYALGGGFELALSCDFIVASSNSFFGATEINLGIVPGWGATQKLLASAGLAKAREIVMLGEMFSADEALKLGIVSRVVPAEKLIEEALALGGKLSQKSPVALSIAKSVFSGASRSILGPGFEIEKSMFFVAISSEDAREGISAFLERRKPRWQL
ncbi:MAG: enoyl-CoA hydratase/isomerase family protein [Sulfolobales archaeon]|nr:enoyl-CoA hydratase/isomerase family protein [Sulfolobales archaeon]MCX8209338.1 enoyl-CoA hydratase/isomerase family protein [Sulfolobales archaeon]MDW8010446.1 enoyl-CoA hydratase/isomerase family protein [Sulfolobales archaeon]